MSKSMKAALLSALVFPGAGHLFLKKLKRGFILMAITAMSIYLVLSSTLEKSLLIAEKIQRGEIKLDPVAIAELAIQQPVGNDAQLVNMAAILFVFCWFAGIIDSYRAARTSNTEADD